MLAVMSTTMKVSAIMGMEAPSRDITSCERSDFSWNHDIVAGSVEPSFPRSCSAKSVVGGWNKGAAAETGVRLMYGLMALLVLLYVVLRHRVHQGS